MKLVKPSKQSSIPQILIHLNFRITLSILAFALSNCKTPGQETENNLRAQESMHGPQAQVHFRFELQDVPVPVAAMGCMESGSLRFTRSTSEFVGYYSIRVAPAPGLPSNDHGVAERCARQIQGVEGVENLLSISHSTATSNEPWTDARPSSDLSRVRKIGVSGAKAAVLEPHSGLLFVARGDEGMQAFSFEDGIPRPAGDAYQGHFDQIVLYNRNLVTVEQAEGVTQIVTRYFLRPHVILDKFSLSSAVAADSVAIVGSDLLALVGQGQMSSVTFVDLSEKTITGRFEGVTEGMVYPYPGIDSRDGKLFVPGGYPGEVVTINAQDKGSIFIVEPRIEMLNWIHDVKLLGNDTFVTAGSTQGITIGSLETQQWQLITDNRQARLKVQDSVVFAAGKSRALKIDPTSKEVIISIDIETDGIHLIPIDIDTLGHFLILDVESEEIIAAQF
jgi:hypothetical protein